MNQTHDQDDRRTLNASITINNQPKPRCRKESLKKAPIIIEAQAVKEMATAKFICKKLAKTPQVEKKCFT